MREYAQFFNRFYLYTDQANVEKLKKSVLHKFKEIFCCGEGVCGKYLEFVTEWSIREGKKEKLNKSQMKRAIAIRVLSQFIEPYTCSIVNDKTKLIREAISKFAVTVFESSLVEDVKKIYGDFETELLETKDMDVIRQKFQLSSDKIDDVNNLSDDQSTKLLWLMNRCPLIVVESEATLKIIQLCDDARFILLGNDHFKEKLPNVSIFRNLSDLDNESKMIEKICITFKCSLQGREEVSLKFLIDQNEDIRIIVTTNELLQMTKDSFVVGEPLETLPIPHVERFLSTNIIDYKYLNEINQNHLVVISCMEKLDQIKIHFSNFDVIKIKEYLQGHNVKQDSSFHQSESSKVFKHPIYISEVECSPKEFDEICDKNKTLTICHHFRINHDAKLEWVASKGKDSDLIKYRSQNAFVEESCWLKYKFDNKINVICADAGMGKSVFIKNLKNKLSSEFWTILICPKDISSYFYGKNQQPNDFTEFIINKTRERHKGFALKLLELSWRNNRIAYFWDGLDEISDQNLELVLEIIDRMSKKGCIQFATSRSLLRHTLESKLNVLSRNLKEFDDEQQTSYIQRRLVQNCSQNDTQDITLKIKRNIAIAHHNEILGIPLQIFMFTELFRQDSKHYTSLLDNEFSVTDLYYHYVDGKFNFHYKGKLNLDDSDYLQNQLLDELKRKHLENYERAALKAHLDAQIVKDLNIDCNQFLEEIKNKSDIFGLITDISEHQIPNFIHNSYGEYFVATFFSKNYRNVAKFKELIFEEKYTNIRFLFDLLLARNCPVHIAVLHKNLEALKNNEDQLNCKDGGGRNPLQLASSWGERYPLFDTTTNGEHYLVDPTRGSSVKEENLEYREILEFLIDRCDFKETDDLFNMDSSSYADHSLCLLPLVLFSDKQNQIRNDLTNFTDVCTILYYSVKFNYSNMFDLIQEIPFIETNKGYSLLHLSAEYCRLNCLRKFLTINIYKQMINKRDSNGRTPIYVACQYGQDKVVRLLIEFGADINIVNSGGHSPIYIACQEGHCEIIKVLVASGADINSTSTDGDTTTWVACHAGHVEVLRLLMEFGADINISDKDNYAPIFAACWFGHCEVVKLLIESKADINCTTINGNTSISVACVEGHVEVIRLLIEFGADVNIGDKYGYFPILYACLNGHCDIVKLLIESGADINSANSSGATTSYIACFNGHVEVVRLLIESGADVNIADNDGFTPIYVACEKGHCKIVKLLVASGADINSAIRDGTTTTSTACLNGHVEVVRSLIKLGADINIGDNDGFTPIYVACQEGDSKIVELLVKSGADINSAIKALTTACVRGHVEVVQLLIELGADINIVDYYGFSPILIACRYGHCEIVRLLFQSGANIDSSIHNGATTTYIACQNGQIGVVRLLVDLGADITSSDNHGISPIFVACMNGHCDIVKLLAESGADINGTNRNGITTTYIACASGQVEMVHLLIRLGADICVNNSVSLIYVACLYGHRKVVELLIESGADINSANRNGTTAIYTACQNGYVDVVRLLIEFGADVNIPDNNGTSPIHVAAKNGHPEIVELLVNS